MTRKYTKAEAIGIVVRCAQTYKQELDGKNLLFICTDKHKKTIPIELSFYGNNYLHLTGLKAPKSENGDIAVELFANDFYQKCLDHKLSPADFDFAEDGTIHMKSDVLPTVISKNLQASLIFLYFYHFTLAACVFLLFPRAGNRYAVTAFKHLFSLLPRGKAGKRR